VVEVKTQNHIARIQHGVIDSRIGGSARVRLNVGVLGPEKFFQPVNGELFRHVERRPG